MSDQIHRGASMVMSPMCPLLPCVTCVGAFQASAHGKMRTLLEEPGAYMNMSFACARGLRYLE